MRAAHIVAAQTVLAAGLALALPAPADEPLVSDRPDFTESAESLPPGRWQLEAGATFERDGDDEATTVGEILLRIGLLPRWELRVALPSYVDTRTGPDGFDDLGLGAKVHLADGGGASPAVAVLFGTSLPTGSSGLREERFQPEVVLSLAWELGDGIGLGSNLGYARPVDGERFDQAFASVGLGFDLGGDWGAFTELYGFSRETPGGDATLHADAGLTRLLSPDLQLDLRAGTVLRGDGPDLLVGVGVVARF